MKIGTGISLTIAVVTSTLFGVVLHAGTAHAALKAVTVDCDKGETIAAALAKAKGRPIVITIQGTCNENVLVNQDGVTLVAGPAGATINGPDATQATITAAGQDIVIDGLQVTGGRNGIDGVGAVRLTIQNCLVQNTGRTGVVLEAGANGTVNQCTIQNNPRDGIAVTFGASAVVINSTITGNSRRGVQVFQNSNALVGITRTNQLAGNTISNNGTRGVSVITGSSASIGGNMISGNGTNATPPLGAADRTGIFVLQSVADIAGGNTISGNAAAGVFVNDGRALVGDAVFGFTTVNTITGNGAGVAPGFGNGGVFGFRAASLQIQDANISGNTGSGVTLQLRSTAIMFNDTVNNNTGNGMLLNQGGGLFLANPALTVTGNGGFGLQCLDGESSFAGNASGITGNTAGQVSASCTGF